MGKPEDARDAAVDAIRNLVERAQERQLGNNCDHRGVVGEDVANFVPPNEQGNHDGGVEAGTAG